MSIDNSLYNNTNVAFSFDFFSLMSRRDIAKKIAKYLKFDAEYFGRFMPGGDISGKRFRVVRNDIGGEKMVQLQTPYFPYYEAVNIAFKLFDLIGTFGYTTNKCAATLYIRYDSKALSVPEVNKINKLKLIIGVDECCSEQLRKTLREDDYVSSLNYIYPSSVLTYDNKINDFIDFNNFKYPNSSKFDIDFGSIQGGCIAVRYLQKKNYEKEKRNFKLFMDRVIRSSFSALCSSNEYTQDELTKIEKVLGNQRTLLKSIWTYDDFVKAFPKIQLMVDLKAGYDSLKFYYPKMRDNIFKLICYGHMTEGGINYDSEFGKFQVKEATLVNSQYLSDIDFYYCDLTGTFDRCRMNECNIYKSKLSNCEIMYGTKMKDCRVYECQFHGIEIYAYDSFIKNSSDALIEASLNNCVIQGKIEFNSFVDEKTEIIE